MRFLKFFLAVPAIAIMLSSSPVYAGKDKTYMAWVTRPEDTDLRDYLSSKILEMRDKGIIDEIQDKWFGFRMPIPSEGHLPEGAL